MSKNNKQKQLQKQLTVPTQADFEACTTGAVVLDHFERGSGDAFYRKFPSGIWLEVAAPDGLVTGSVAFTDYDMAEDAKHTKILRTGWPDQAKTVQEDKGRCTILNEKCATLEARVKELEEKLRIAECRFKAGDRVSQKDSVKLPVGTIVTVTETRTADGWVNADGVTLHEHELGTCVVVSVPKEEIKRDPFC